jgi:hypothetical protein
MAGKPLKALDPEGFLNSDRGAGFAFALFID